MQDTLFETPPEGEQIQLEDAHLQYFPRFYPQAKASDLFEVLKQQIPWQQEQIRIAGVPRLQPRLSAWFGDAEAEYTYSGLHLTPLPWHPLLQQIKSDIETMAHPILPPTLITRGNSFFNSVLLNFYRDQHDSMGWHSDDEAELGPQPIIASLSLGGTRVFALKHKLRKDLRCKIPLENGSLLIMSGNTQSHWQHAVAKEKAECKARINLTFRRIFPLSMV